MVHDRGLAWRTIVDYTIDLKQFFRYPESQGIEHVDQIDRNTIRGFLEVLRQEGYKPSSIGRKLGTVRVYCQFLTIRGWLPSDPTKKMKGPKPAETLRRHLTEEEVQALLDQASDDNPYDVRNRAALELLYSAGLGIGELTNLHINDIDLDEASVTVRQGKGQKDRLVPIGERAVSVVARYLTESRPTFADGLPNSPFLFLNRRGRPLDHHGVRNPLTEYAKAAGIKKRVTPHMRCVTPMLERYGGDCPPLP